MLELLKARRGRKAAVAMIAPLVEQSRRRLVNIPDAAWFDPYIVGFMAMLISLIANRATGGINSQTVGIVQTEAWREIVGCGPDLIGEEICLLSAANDSKFMDGCRNAGQLIKAVSMPQGTSGQFHDMTDGLEGRHGFDPGHNDELRIASSLWPEYFDAHIVH